MASGWRHFSDLSERHFLEEYQRLRRGSITRRQFLRATGLALTCTLIPGLVRRPASATGDTKQSVRLGTWPNYHDPEVLKAFTEATGLDVEIEVFGSNEEMLSRLRSGRARWDLFIPTNYTISTYRDLDLIEELDGNRLPNLDMEMENSRFTRPGIIDGRLYAIPRNWGTTGMAFNGDVVSSPPTTWKDFFELAATEASGRTIVHDYQLTAIGNALVSLGYSFNSVDETELAEAEKLLLALKPHLLAVDSDYQAAMRAGDAWLSMCWSNDAAQLVRDVPAIRYQIGADGGEVWTDFYAIPKNAPNKRAGYALLDFLLAPAIASRELANSGAGATDGRVLRLLPDELVKSRISYPDEAALTPLEFGAAVTLTNPLRQEIMARFRAA
ncbi:extracellular solute-binding protein [Ciceribacter sp. L1K22]|uniref:ABC transporter substrate-binding protein n=1 Tax=Ciceribacter sp. L1K22 TaxID=2820275 RepID=UPI001ABDABBA|nr:spermidine/putrescine ABC transporter substrate-binding protein [Ciceribacter sp. L1K22]